MTERVPPLNLQNLSTHTAAGDRALIHSIYGGREGVTGTTDLAVSQNGSPNMSVNVAAGRGVVFGDSTSDQQLYHIWNDATVNKTISAADPTNPRRDLIVAEVRDAQTDGGGNNDWRLRVVTGTPAGSPADPATPNTALVLARVAVAAGATSITNANITDLRPRAGAIASVDVVCTSTTRPTTGLFQGMRIYETDTFATLVWTTATTGWRPPWNMPWGRVASTKITAVAGGYTGTVVDVTGLSVSVNFVAGRRYRIQIQSEVSSSVVADVGVMQLTDSSNTQLGRAVQYYSHGGAHTLHVLHEETAASSATVTRKARYSRALGSGTHQIEASATSPSWLIVEDIGPAANPL